MYRADWVVGGNTLFASELQVDWGDGTTSSSSMQLVYATGNTTNDWMLGYASWAHAYASSTVNNTITSVTCCLSTIVPPATIATFSPVLTSIPVITIPAGSPYVVSTPIQYPGGRAYYAFFAHTDRSNLSTTGVVGAGAFVGQRFAWTPPGVGLFTIQLVVADSQYNYLDSPIEFLINATSVTQPSAATVVSDQSGLVFDGFNVSAGYTETMSMTLRATNADGVSPVALITNVLPTNATITDCAEGVWPSMPPFSIGSQCTRTISWTLGSGAQTSDVVVATLVPDGLASPPSYYGFRVIPPQPIITSFLPASGPTGGSAVLTVCGTFLPVVADLRDTTVRINASKCSNPILSSGCILCVTPPGEGLNQTVTVWTTTYPRPNVPINTGYNYSPPSISSIFPTTGTTEGAFRLTLSGFNFGRFYQVVLVGGVVQTPFTCTDGSCVVTMLPSVGGFHLPVNLTVVGQTNAVARFFSFIAPTITSIYSATLAYPTKGGVNITFSGFNFGLAGGPIAVTIGGSDCPVTSHAHRVVVCTLPSGAGATNPVTFVVSGQATTTTGLNVAYDPLPTPSSQLLVFQSDSGNVAETTATQFYPTNVTYVRLPDPSVRYDTQPSHATQESTPLTLDPNDLLLGIVVSTSATAKSWTLPTPALMVAAMAAATTTQSLQVYDSFEFSVVAAASAITLVVPSGVTAYWTSAVVNNDSSLFRLVLTSIASGSEAYSIYLLA